MSAESSGAENTATGQHGMVATVHPLATEAGVAALKRGGNAMDAAVAAALTLGVVDNHNSGLGGGCFILVARADGGLDAIDGRETAPAKATRDMFLRDGKPQPHLSQTGALAIATPGALAAYDLAILNHGKLTLAELLLPAAKIAEQGFAIDRVYAGKLAASAADLRKLKGPSGTLLKADGAAYVEGETLRQPDLAKTYRAIAKIGPDWFYRGPFAQATEKWMKAHGGLMTAADFAAYSPAVHPPLITSYRDYVILGFPPPSSGGVGIAQMLGVLERFDLQQLRRKDEFISADVAHLLAETMKRAFADRAHWMGDPAFTRVPRGLSHHDYARALADQIDMTRATPASHGLPPAWESEVFSRIQGQFDLKHTTHIAAADVEGNWVAITATVNTTFGAKVVIPGTGVVMNNEMDDFAIAPGTPNAFGLIGAEANSVAPGKRPLSSMSPTIVLKDGKPIMTLGAAGGPKIITQVLLVLLRTLDGGQSLADAVAAPRLHHQWSPDVFFLERGHPESLIEDLRRRGHTVKQLESPGVCQAIGLAPDGKSFIGVSDPRVPGKAMGY